PAPPPIVVSPPDPPPPVGVLPPPVVDFPPPVEPPPRAAVGRSPAAAMTALPPGSADVSTAFDARPLAPCARAEDAGPTTPVIPTTATIAAPCAAIAVCATARCTQPRIGVEAIQAAGPVVPQG